MHSKLRFATLGLLVLAAVGLLAVSGWSLWVASDDFFDVATLGRSHLERGLFVVSHHPSARMWAGAGIGLGIMALGLAFLIGRGRARWPLVPIPPVALALIAVAWRGRDWVARFEPPGYRSRSKYVQAASFLALAVTVYLVVLMVLAIAAWFVRRPASAESPAAQD